MADSGPVPDLRPSIVNNLLSPVVALVAIVGAIVSVVTWAAKTPDAGKFEKIQNDVFDVKMEQAIMKKDVRALQDSAQRVEAQQTSQTGKLDQLLLQRRK